MWNIKVMMYTTNLGVHTEACSAGKQQPLQQMKSRTLRSILAVRATRLQWVVHLSWTAPLSWRAQVCSRQHGHNLRRFCLVRNSNACAGLQAGMSLMIVVVQQL